MKTLYYTMYQTEVITEKIYDCKSLYLNTHTYILKPNHSNSFVDSEKGLCSISNIRRVIHNRYHNATASRRLYRMKIYSALSISFLIQYTNTHLLIQLHLIWSTSTQRKTNNKYIKVFNDNNDVLRNKYEKFIFTSIALNSSLQNNFCTFSYLFYINIVNCSLIKEKQISFCLCYNAFVLNSMLQILAFLFVGDRANKI